MAYVSDVTNRFGEKEREIPDAKDLPDNEEDVLTTSNDQLETYENTDLVEETYNAPHDSGIKLPKLLFYDAQANYNGYVDIKNISKTYPREEVRYGMTNEPYPAPYAWIPLRVDGFNSVEPLTAVAIPPNYTVTKKNEHAWDCGCLHDY